MAFNLGVWSTLSGFIEPDEGQLIYEEALKQPCGAKIIEIGPYHGKSTVALLQGCKDSTCQPDNQKKVLSIDKFDGQGMTQGDATPQSQQAGRGIVLSVIAEYGLLQWLDDVGISDSQEWFAKNGPALAGKVDMFFIDGYHGIVDKDIRAAIPLMKPGGVILCHDFWPIPHQLDWITKKILSVGLDFVRLGNTNLGKAIVK